VKAQGEFFTAIIMGDLDAVKRIFPRHPDALSWQTSGEYPPLHMAIMNRREDIAIWLVEHGADLSQKAHGDTAAKLADNKGMLDKLHEAEGRRAQCRQMEEQRRQAEIDSCGDEMRKGLESPVAIAKKPLALKRPGLS
jgi:hypothetical protein